MAKFNLLSQDSPKEPELSGYSTEYQIGHCIDDIMLIVPNEQEGAGTLDALVRYMLQETEVSCHYQ